MDESDPGNTKLLSDLNALISIARQLGGTLDLDVLLASIEKAALDLLDCERVSVLIYDRDTDELYSRLSTGGDHIRFPADRGIAGETARTTVTINVPDAYADSRFNPEVDKSTGFRTHNILSLAMDGYDGRLIGVLQFLNKRRGAFVARDERLAYTFGALAGVAIQRQLLLEESALRQKMERDLDLARTIQKGCLPDANPEVDGYDIVGWNQPADQTGGDFYDFIRLGQREVGLLLADASGHGIGPALVVAECRALIRGLATTTMDLNQIILEANSVLVQDLGDGRFVTACLAVLDSENGTVRYISAGHAPSLLYVSAEDRFEEIPASGGPLGIMPDFRWEAPPPFTLQRGDLLILFTDGFHETRRPDKELFGVERVLAVIRSYRDAPAAEIIRQLHEAVASFSEGAPQQDDLTAVVVKRCS